MQAHLRRISILFHTLQWIMHLPWQDCCGEICSDVTMKKLLMRAIDESCWLISALITESLKQNIQSHHPWLQYECSNWGWVGAFSHCFFVMNGLTVCWCFLGYPQAYRQTPVQCVGRINSSRGLNLVSETIINCGLQPLHIAIWWVVQIRK